MKRVLVSIGSNIGDRLSFLQKAVEETNRLHLRAELIEPTLRPAAREFAACSSETLIALVYPPGTKAPVMNTIETSTADWKSLDTSGGAREVSWFNGDGQFWTRVGLYRQKLVSRNPWWYSARRGAREGPETQYAVTLPGPGTGPYGDPDRPAPPLSQVWSRRRPA